MNLQSTAEDNLARKTVRVANLADLEIVIRHRHLMFAEMGYPEAPLAAMDLEAGSYFAQAFRDGTYRHWFIDANGGVAAGAGVSINPFYPGPRDPRPRRAWLLNVYTAPPYRNQGLARQLVETAIAWCRGEGLCSLYLHASSFGQPLYERLGFVSSREMRLDLTSGNEFTNS